jgi:hypothetical protein
VGNKDLTALLRTLRRFGVTRYQTADMTLELGAAPEAPARALPKSRPGEQAFNGPAVGEDGFQLPDLAPEDGDPATLIIDLAEKNFPKEGLRRPTRVMRPEAVGE